MERSPRAAVSRELEGVNAMIKILPLSDHHGCETCGSTYAEGYHVTMPDGSEFALEPVAHCFDDQNWTETDLMVEILKRLGHEVQFIEELPKCD